MALPTGVDHYWSQGSNALITALHSSLEGLTTAEAEQRLEQVGPNLVKAKRQATALELFLSQFKSPITLMLLFATGVSAVLGEWVDAAIVLAIILGSAVLSFAQLILVFIVFAANVFFHKPVIDSLLFSIALAVGLTPQLLPAIISINLSKGSQAMAAHADRHTGHCGRDHCPALLAAQRAAGLRPTAPAYALDTPADHRPVRDHV